MEQLLKTERLPNGKFRRSVKVPWTVDAQETDFYSIRFALAWPTSKSPGYFIGAGEEAYDERLYAPAEGRGVIKILTEHEYNDLSLDSFFEELTDQVVSNLAESCYADLKEGEGMANDGFKRALYDFLDRKKLRNISIQKAPFDNFVLRIGIVKSWDEAGNLRIEKNTPLYSELEGISRVDLSDPDVESKFFRLNCLSFLLGGFQKYRPVKRLRERTNFGESDWML